MSSFVLLQQRGQFSSTRQCVIVTSTAQMQRLRHFNANEANTTPLSDCKVEVAIQCQYVIATATSATTATRQCSVNTLLERQSGSATSTSQCNVNMLLKGQSISTTSTRHATWTI